MGGRIFVPELGADLPCQKSGQRMVQSKGWSAEQDLLPKTFYPCISWKEDACDAVAFAVPHSGAGMPVGSDFRIQANGIAGMTRQRTASQLRHTCVTQKAAGWQNRILISLPLALFFSFSFSPLLPDYDSHTLTHTRKRQLRGK